MKTFKLLSILLLYPDESIKSALQEIRAYINELNLNQLLAILDYLQNTDLFELQKHYTLIFDLTPSCTLYLLEHFPESKNKGMKLLEFSEKYASLGLITQQNQTPDFLPMYLEYLSIIEKERAIEEISFYEDIFKKIYSHLVASNSPYMHIFELLSKKEVLYAIH